MSFTKAIRVNLFAKILIYGFSGSGKTPSSLRLGKGIIDAGGGTTLGLIDTEQGKSRLYAPANGEKPDSESLLFDFMHYDLQDHSVEGYINALNAAKEIGIDVLIIDSISQEWNNLLIENEKLGQSAFKGNSWAAWSKSTPKHQKFIKTILTYPGHVIVTSRVKTEWADFAGKPTKVGLAPTQRNDVEYEFDIVIRLDKDNSAEIIRGRNFPEHGKIIELIDESFGHKIVD